MADADSEREDIRDLLLVLIGVTLAVTFQSLNDGLDALIYPQGSPSYTFVESKFLLFVGFLILTFGLLRTFKRLRRRKS